MAGYIEDGDLFDLIDEYLNSHLKDEADEVDDDDWVECAPNCNGETTGKHSQECNDLFWETFPQYSGVSKPSGGKSATSAADAGTLWSSSSWSKWSKCDRHYLTAYELSDGTIVHGSTHHTRSGDNEPDLACYLDGIWTPQTIAYHIGWKDFGLPYLEVDDVMEIAERLLFAARAGKVVEIGCIGGHGRTGTMLALLDVMTMERADADLAIGRVRSLYCKHAIETRDQEWYVAVVAALRNGEEIPAKPAPPVKPKPAKAPAKKAAAKKQKKTSRDTRNNNRRKR